MRKLRRPNSPISAFSRILRWAVAATSVAASIMAIITFLGLTTRWVGETPMLSFETERKSALDDLQRRQIAAQVELKKARRDAEMGRIELQHLHLQLEELRARAGKPANTAEASRLAASIANIRNDLADISKRADDTDVKSQALDKRLGGLEGAIVADPQKAVAVPLLRRDLESLQQQTAHDFEAVHAESNRLYDLMKLLIGLMGLISFGLLGTAIGNVFKRESRDIPQKESASKVEAKGEPAVPLVT